MLAYDAKSQEEHECASIFIFGASGYGHAMSFVLRYGFLPNGLCRTAGFIDDQEGGKGADLEGTPILSFEEWRRDSRDRPVLVSVGAPASRRVIVERLQQAGASFAKPYARLPPGVFPGVHLDAGTFIGPSTYIGPLTVIGEHCQIMSACSVGHDVEIGDFCTICPSSTVSGHVVIEQGVFIGAGSTIVNGRPGAPIRIGRGAKISAGSVVTKSVPEGGKVAGNPARPLRQIALERAHAAA